jgi:hypothetical protein
MLAVLVLFYGGSLLGGAPPGMRIVAIGGIIFGWLFVGWAAWVDRHRDAALQDIALPS